MAGRPRADCEILRRITLFGRAGEIINELTVAIKEGVGLGALGRVIHPYPSTGESVMGAGLMYIRSQWAKLPPK